jgi:hypothetical protein
MVDLHQTRDGLIQLTSVAIAAAGTLEEVVEVAEAAAAIGDPGLVQAVAERISREVEEAMRSSGAWEAELTYSKIDAWAHTGHKARALALAWGHIAPLLDLDAVARRDGSDGEEGSPAG